jgi:predicted GIY-YIG superfamily endonuclease
MNHYLYLLTFSNGKQYIGARSTKLKPELDTLYLGSGRALPKRTPQDCNKQILKTFNSRKELIKAEIQYIIDNNCIDSDNFYNLRKCTYDRHGTTCEKTSKILTGRTKQTHKYIENAAKKHTAYIGKNRTPAQIEKDKLHGDKIRGIKNKDKGHPGITNCAFIPWYYIDNAGNYYEILEETKEDFAKKLGITRRQLIHRFHYNNEHKPAKFSKKIPESIRGFTFGNLPRPTNTDRD